MRIVCVSDLHNQQPELPEGDCLIVAGDLTHTGEFSELMQSVQWFHKLRNKFDHVAFIAGNHDVCLQNLLDNGKEQELIQRLSAKNIHYLRDSAITINGVTFYGMPWVPQYAGAWNTDDMKSPCDQIPSDVDVLITHSAPRGILDGGMGCPELRSALIRLRNLKLHTFGHCEEFYGRTSLNGVTFCNAALSTRRTDQGVRQPIVVELQTQKSAAAALL